MIAASDGGGLSSPLFELCAVEAYADCPPNFGWDDFANATWSTRAALSSRAWNLTAPPR